MNTEISDIGLNCTKLCSGYDSCLDAVNDVKSNGGDFVAIKTLCNHINNDINKDSNPSAFNTYVSSVCSIM